MDWVKRCPTASAAAREAAGLRWLATADGGPRVVAVHAVDGARLTLERVPDGGRPDASAAASFGAALARMHAAGAAFWGAPPPGSGGDGRIGAAVLATPADARTAPAAWGAFYVRCRVLPHLRSAVGRGSVTAAGAAVIERVADRLAAGELDHPQPGLLAPDAPARLHGDLWSGNVLWDAGGAVLIDPAAHGGHAETDLAMLALFGAPHLGEILAGYDGVSPLAPGWRDRVALHQLHPLLVHAELFGPSYGRDAVDAARGYLD